MAMYRALPDLPRSLVLAGTLAIAAIAPVTAAQSQSELRRENQRLQAQVRDLEAELEAARQRIEELEQQIAQLREALRAGEGGSTIRVPMPPIAEPTVTIDESSPASTPRALRRSLSQRYAEDLGMLPKGEHGDKERIQYLRATRSWVAQVNRELRTPIAWPVRLAKVIGIDRGLVVELQTVDPVTEAALGDPFLVHLSASLARRLQTLEQSRMTGDVFMLRGTLVPGVRFNERRMDPGPFDNPPLLGPFAEFAFGIEPRSLKPFVEDQASAVQDVGS